MKMMVCALAIPLIGSLVFVVFVVFVVCIWSLNVAQAARPIFVPPFSSSLPVEPKPILLDDFKDGDWQNNLGGNTDCLHSDLASITCIMQVVGNDGFLEMQYDVDVIAPVTYAWYYSELNDLNMNALDAVWIAVKGEAGSEPIYVEFKDCGQHFPKKLISDYLPKGILSSDWSAVAIPLTEFSEITDWSCIERLSIMAHNEIDSRQGTIYVDEVRLLPAQVSAVFFALLYRAARVRGDVARGCGRG